jgi:hypothetical protein
MDNRADKKQDQTKMKNTQQNECPKKDKDGNCLVPGVYSDSDPIGGA